MFVHTDRPMKLQTPAGADVLMLVSFQGHEAISELFHVRLELVSQQETVDFDKLLGQTVGVEWDIGHDQPRYFNGMVSRLSQAERTVSFTRYSMEIVPKVWLLTHRARSRIFQHLAVPDILRKVLEGYEVRYELTGTFEPRDYCVQYRETDFQFLSRLMEEEGIFYFFEHTADGHTMVVANNSQSHADLPGDSTVIFEEIGGGTRDEERVSSWEKTQELRSGKYTLWDHCFELPGKNLEAARTIMESVQISRTTHKLRIGGNDQLELYDYPGGYAQRFDGVTPGGGDNSSDIQKIFQDNTRTVEIRMQEEALPSLVIQGGGEVQEFASGYKFNLTRHFSDDGKYVLTSVDHFARQPLASEQVAEEGWRYENRFTAIPYAVPFRPRRITPVPVVRGTQTATVVGPSGEEIYTDKYGRIRVQFHWDRDGKKDVNSSCWVRVATPWAGKQWGMVHIPRIGQEVVVDFLEGDPDRPIVIGSVYNAEQMPPYALPDNRTQSGIKSRSSKGGGADNFNEIRLEDKKGQEQIFIHAEKDLLTEVENDETRTVGHDRTTTIKNHETKEVTEGNESTTIKKGDRTLEVTMGKQTHTIQGDTTLHIKQGSQSTTIDMGNKSTTIKMGNMTTKLNLGKSEEEALQSIELKVGQSSIKVDQMGVTIKGMMIKVEGQIMTQIKGMMTQVNGDAMLTCKGGITMIN